jgi:DNA-binding transcriptional ArsR family regulator
MMSDLSECRHDPLDAAPALPAAATLEAAAAILRAAGDAARLRLLLRLAEGERCVSELAAMEGEKLGTVSARLRQLHGARLVTRRREAKHVNYALADDHVARLLRDIIDHAAEGPVLN